MKLSQLVNLEELSNFIQSGYIRIQRHPSLPLIIYNYSNSCMFEDFWPETVCQCRGLVTTAEDNCQDRIVVSRGFRKFFNLGHTSQPDYQEANLPKVIPTVTEKMDGWFGILYKCITPDNENGDTHYGIASRGSFTSTGAEFATAKLGKLIKYGAIHEFPDGYTPTFEIISKTCRIVVDYPFEGLVLLALINNETGEEMPYDEMRNIWAKIASYSKGSPWIRLVHAHNLGDRPFDKIKAIEQGTEYEYNKDGKFDKIEKWESKNTEGFVLTYPRPGTYPIKVKVKFEEYKRLHKLITGVTPQAIWRTFCNPMSRWEGEGIPRGFHDWSVEWRDKLYGEFNSRLQYIAKLAALAVDAVAQLEPIDTKDPAQRKRLFELLSVQDSSNAVIAMSLIEGKIYDAYQAIWDKVRPITNESETYYRDNQGE